MKCKFKKRIMTLTGIVSTAALSMAPMPVSEMISSTNTGKTMTDHKQSLYDMQLKDYSRLDSLVEAAKSATSSTLYMPEYRDSIFYQQTTYALTRPKMNSEHLVDRILSNTGIINMYTPVVDKYFIKASIEVESGYTPRISSTVGALGLMQFMEDTWKQFGDGPYLPNVFDPEKNIRAGIRYYTWMEKELANKFQKKWSELSIEEKQDILAAAYNGGHGAMINARLRIGAMPRQSEEHVVKVRNVMNGLRTEDLLRSVVSYEKQLHDKWNNKMFASIVPRIPEQVYSPKKYFF